MPLTLAQKSAECLVLLALAGVAVADPAAPAASSAPLDRLAQPAAIELNWTPLKLPTGEHSALLGASYMVAMDDDWGIGPSVYGAGKGDVGGLFVLGFTAQRRWRLSPDWYAAASLTAGGGGGLSSGALRFGGGLMLRPELSLRTDFRWGYAGVSVAQTRFPTGNVDGTSVGLVLGFSDTFVSYAPTDAGATASPWGRTGPGIDEVLPTVGFDRPRSGTLDRSGNPIAHLEKAGAALRQYLNEGSWWEVEAAGAGGGGHAGYMEVLVGAGQDWGLFGTERLRAGWQVATGLGGGGNLDTGNGWLLRSGPTLRWVGSGGISLNLGAGLMDALSGHYKAGYVSASLGLSLDSSSRRFDFGSPLPGTIEPQTWYTSVQQLGSVRYKNGTKADIGQIAILMTQQIDTHWYVTARAGSAAFGHAGAYSFGLMGLGIQTAPMGDTKRWTVGVESLLGASGGGGVDVSGGAASQSELWAQWAGGADKRLRLRLGWGLWHTLRGQQQSANGVDLAVGYAFGQVIR